MVDISLGAPQSSPPDRRLLAKLTDDPKIIRYFENLSFDITGSGQDGLAILLELIVNAAELAGAAQGSANANRQAVEELAVAFQSIDLPGAILQRLGSAIDELISLVQSPDQVIQALQRKVDELECQLLEFRPSSISAAFEPSVVTVTSAYAVSSAVAQQPITIRADATSAAFSVTLPAAPTLLQAATIKKVDASGNTVTINGNGKLIDGAPTVVMGVQYAFRQVQYNGASWDVVSS